MEHLRTTSIPRVARQYEPIFKEIFDFELSSLSLLSEQKLLFEAVDLHFNNMEEMEDLYGYPVDASLTEIGIDSSTF